MVREGAIGPGPAGEDLSAPIAVALAIDPAAATMRRPRVDVMTGDGPQRRVMEADPIGSAGGPPRIEPVTDDPSGHFFALPATALRP